MKYALKQFFVSENAIIDHRKGLLSLINIFDDQLEVSGIGFPLVFPHLVLSAKYTVQLSPDESTGKVTVTADIVDSKGKSVITDKPTKEKIVKRLRGKEQRFGIILTVSPLELPKAGKYRFLLYFNGKLEREQSIKVEKMKS